MRNYSDTSQSLPSPQAPVIRDSGSIGAGQAQLDLVAIATAEPLEVPPEVPPHDPETGELLEVPASPKG